MPKIRISENDNTGAVQLSAISNTVYIPGKTAKKDSNDSFVAIEPTLFTSASQFVAVEDYDTSCLSWKLAKRILSLGLYVVYEALVEEDNQVDIDWSKLKDKTKFDLRFLTTGGYACPSSDMISCAADRGDCIALLDHPAILPDKSGAHTDNSQVAKVRRFFESYTGTSTINADADSFAAAFTPWFQTKVDDFRIEGESTYYDIPASFGYLFAYARSIKTNPTWYAVAGSFRGSIPELSGVTYKYSEAEVEMLQARGKDGVVELGTGDTPYLDNDNVGKAINPIAYEGESFGYLIWGNRTFRTNDAAKRTIATSFLNVRNLISEVKKAMFNAARKYTFEPNDDVLWINFQSQVLPILNKMQTGNGILGFRFTRLKTTAKARLRANLTLVPIEAVEDFELQVSLEDSLEVAE